MKLLTQYGLPMNEAREEKVVNVISHRQNDITIVLENIHDPHNVSAILRSCDAIGIMEVFILNTKENLFRNFDRRKSASAHKWMMIHQFTDAETCFKEVKKKYHKVYSTFLSNDARDLYELNFCEPMALVFGNEKDGISEETLAFCDTNFMIPQVGMISSLNVSVACAVCLYEAFRQKQLAHHYDFIKLNNDEQKELLSYWDMKKG
ncbi:MAG: RNA methyltransferase [Bacteroidetes bacterium]|nr:RNA methyltransferase [Bacteroidota bacterium]